MNRLSSKPPARIEYEIGKSQPDRDWPARQRTDQTNSVLFQLDSPEGTYTLKIAALIDRPRVPALEVDVNGHKGTFFLHPKLSYSRSDFSYAFDPHESQSALEIDIPRSFLKAGQNILTLTCRGLPATPQGQEELGGISYDALSLSQNANSTQVKSNTLIAAEPTVFYHQSSEGSKEVVDVFCSGSAEIGGQA
jgi:alpha-mannosidase